MEIIIYSLKLWDYHTVNLSANFKNQQLYMEKFSIFLKMSDSMFEAIIQKKNYSSPKLR